MNNEGVVWVKLVAAIAAAVWVGLHPLYQALLVLIVADIIVGVLASLATGEKLSSDVSYRGIVRKVLKVIMVGLAAYLEPYVGGVPLGPAVAGYWCADELLSIVENYGRAGLPVPKALRDALAKLSPSQPEQSDDRDRTR
jgi:toxin secretion/phage lysis holin